MGKIDTSNIDKNRRISDYEQKYGSGETMTKIFTFELLKWFIVGIIILFTLTTGGIILFAHMERDISPMVNIFSIGFNVVGGALMALIGYFVGKKSE
ncbi:MAG: hypothetical protein LBH71_00105 [Oscillospiraceae bacterium]|jgi:hypothetical protein|nr:hypothetical protein [Oscillospiraceae bacterium]